MSRNVKILEVCRELINSNNKQTSSSDLLIFASFCRKSQKRTKQKVF